MSYKCCHFEFRSGNFPKLPKPFFEVWVTFVLRTTLSKFSTFDSYLVILWDATRTVGCKILLQQSRHGVIQQLDERRRDITDNPSSAVPLPLRPPSHNIERHFLVIMWWWSCTTITKKWWQWRRSQQDGVTSFWQSMINFENRNFETSNFQKVVGDEKSKQKSKLHV